MHSIAWWPNFIVLFIASGIDLHSRRVPNWLSLPFLIAGLLVNSIVGGLTGVGLALGGVALASLLFGIPCVLRGSGMGDLKLAAGVGAWIGADQFLVAFVATGIVGGIFAVGYALMRGRLGECLDNTSELLVHFAKRKLHPHDRIRLGSETALSIPYVPAIAIGTVFSFFT
jgi:prepilin peptidase CpaA